MSSNDKKLVLIVDDTPTNVAVVSGVLKDSPKLPPTARRRWPSPPPQKNRISSCST